MTYVSVVVIVQVAAILSLWQFHCLADLTRAQPVPGSCLCYDTTRIAISSLGKSYVDDVAIALARDVVVVYYAYVRRRHRSRGVTK